MQNIPIKLRDDLIIRKEGNAVLLFNQSNGAVVKISAELFAPLSKGEQLPVAFKAEFVKEKLQRNQMLEVVKQKVPQNNTNNGKVNNLFGLKSSRSPFIVLWAITSRCNLKCIYCFPNVKAQRQEKGLVLDELKEIARQIIAAKVFQVTISGGEALLEPNLWPIIQLLFEQHLKITLISNGTTITQDVIKKLIRYKLIVGISLDAPNELINAITRGKKVFNKTLGGIKGLLQAKVPVVILVTLNRFNFPVLQEHLEFIANLGIRNVTIQDLRPFGTVAKYDKIRLTCEQENSLYVVIENILAKFPQINFNLSELLIFPNPTTKVPKSAKIMPCPAGESFAYIDFHGDLYPCTNLPTMKLGNLLRDGNISQLWQSATVMQQLRQLKEQSIADLPGCVNCYYSKYCNGGCRGDAIFYSNDIHGYASRCPKLIGLYQNK